LNLELISVAVVEHAGRFLIGRRPEGVPLAGKWEFPGGKVHDGESPEAAAARECLEETGLAVTIVAPYPEVVHQYDYGRVHLHFFTATPVDASVQPRPPFRWVQRDQLSQYDFPEANAALIEFLTGRADGK